MKEKALVNDLPLNDENSIAHTDTQYKVLARKYRPKTFADLIGQDSMIKIISNSFSLNRVAHAFLFTGVRGVGKTTAARIISRGLNCLNDEIPTISPCGTCDSCVAAKNDRHVDIVEIDAASHTGVDDIRELTESVRYRPVQGRYKIYIIDEVHMLSTQAFNALLKTLEEPPEHVKFIFCTTEIRKIPVTVLSRCQKFDLRRVAVNELVELLKLICDKEKINIDTESLNLIARYSDGSVRDSLSLLDQAINMSTSSITEETTKIMLGLSDKSVVWNLFDNLIKGDILAVINNYDDLLNSGSDPVLIMEELMEVSHNVARIIAVPTLDTSQVMSEYETKRAQQSAKLTNIPAVARCWQLLLKGQEEMQKSFSVKEACEMILIRISYAMDLPDLKSLIDGAELKKKPKLTDINKINEVIKNDNGKNSNTKESYKTFDQLLKSIKNEKAMLLYTILIDQIKVVEYIPFKIKLSLVDEDNIDIVNVIKKELFNLTSNNWTIEVLENKKEYISVSEKDNLEKNIIIEDAKKDKTIKSFLDEFPDAKVIEVRKDHLERTEEK